MAVRHADSGDCGSYHAERKQLHKTPRTPRPLQRRAKQPKSEHVAEPMPKTGMKEAVSHNLPDPAVSHFARDQAEIIEYRPINARQDQAKQFHEQEDRRVESKQPNYGWRERWQAQRHFPASNHLELLCGSRLLSFGIRNDWQTAMSRRIDRAHTEYDIILRNLQGCTRTATDRLDVLPIRRIRRAPDHLVGSRSGRRLPGQSRVVLEVFGLHFHASRRCWSRCQRGQSRRIEPRDVCHIFEVRKFRQVSVFDAIFGARGLMLMVFAEF